MRKAVRYLLPFGRSLEINNISKILMPQNRISQEEIRKIKGLEGKARGQTIRNALESILLMEGKEGLVKLERRLKEIGCWNEIYKDYKKIKIFEWYPLWYDLLPIVVAVDIFNWDEEKLKQFGRYNQKISFFEKVFLKYFISLEIVFKSSPGRWKKHYRPGDLEPVEFNGKEKNATLRLKNFVGHSSFCSLLLGYFESATSYVVSSKKVKVEETKCVFRGDPYHEFLVRWE